MTELVLTDDEVVALAVERGGRWPVRLPTVDARRPREWGQAAWRGQRSLAVRGLTGVGAPADPVLAAVLDALRCAAVGARAALGLRVGGTPRAAGTLEVNAFVRGADWLVETVSDHGVHGYERVAGDAVVVLMTGLAEQACARGVADGSGRPTRLWVGVVADGRQPWLCVRAQHSSVVTVEDGRVTAGSQRPAEDLRVQIERFAEQVRWEAGVAVVRA